MSEDVTKFALRGRIPELDNKSAKEALDFFRKNMGEPDLVEDDWFEYQNSHFTPIHSSSENAWGIEKIMLLTSEESEMSVSLETVQHTFTEMKAWFPSIPTLIVVGYTWYNGIDEPVTFKPLGE